MKYIADKVDYSILPDVLPIMHSCDGFDCESIIEDMYLKPTMCPVFNEELLYFFYGKPSYPVGEKEQYNRTDELCCPVCFIIEKANLTHEEEMIIKKYYHRNEISDSNYLIGEHTAPYLGFDHTQLCLVLYHNTPNNSIPIIWYGKDALFPRKNRHKVFLRD